MEKYKILIIEDEEITGDLLKQALEMENMAVTWKANGQDALNEMKQDRFDLIILDLKMPGMAGDEVLREIRKIDKYVYVAIFTNQQNPEQMIKLINLDVDAYISKGANTDLWEIVARVKEILRVLSDEERDTLFAYAPKDLFKRGPDDIYL